MPFPDYTSEIVEYLHSRNIPTQPEAAIVLGSGLGSFGKHIKNPVNVSYADIPHFPAVSVEGHAGTLICGEVCGKKIIAFSGRFHHYEGYTFEQIVLPVYLAGALNSGKLIISNAAGAVNARFKVGDLMVIEDVIRQNQMLSPGGMQKHGYIHYSNVERALELAADTGMPVQRGTYLYVNGPNYESKAEIRAFRVMGADAVGMSTAPELFEAARLGLKTVAISLICNMACGVVPGKLSHQEVNAAAETREMEFARLVKMFIEKL